jgi:DNA (cytosine-5)-methyltransferase 1
MKHLGDITKIHGASAPPVNVIIGGSPCQDLSVAGKRAGLQGERSGLFMEQLRIIKEMRRADEHRGRTGTTIRPRFMVWENVPGAFSSNKGADFGAVLQETIRVVYKEAPDIPMPKNGWPTAGALVGMGGDWSIAWRVFDAQFWGVPQRRRRIALVADFGGATAPEILFEREGVSGNFTQSRTPGQAPTSNTEKGTGNTECRVAYCIQGNSIGRSDNAGCGGRGWREDKSYTLNTIDRPAVYAVDQGGGKSGANVSEGKAPTLTCTHGGEPAIAIDSHPMDSRVKLSDDNVVQSLTGRMGTGGATLQWYSKQSKGGADCGRF